MKKRSIIALLAIVAACSAQAQLTYHGYQTDRITVDATLEGSHPWNVTEAFASPHAYFYTESIQSMRPNQLSSVAAQDYASVYYSLSVGNAPVRINTLECLFEGKFVYGGGGINDSAIATLQGRVGLFEYHDTNNNNVYDLGEYTAGVMDSLNVDLAFLAGNGLQEYSQLASASTPGYILAANTKYAVYQRFTMQFVGSLNQFGPSTVITNEYHNPAWTGTVLYMNHEAVPEPATLALLAIALPLLKKRRK